LSFLWLFSSGFLISSAVLLIKIREINLNAIILILLLLQFNDAFAYLFGKKFGKTYLFPTISPNKSLEGYIFGGLGIAIGMTLLHTYIPILSERSWTQDLLIFSTILIFGNVGDLMMSSLKRKLEIKDFSQILPGHGGMLDRFDNTFFIAPVFYLLLNHHLVL
ncbi:MAG: phosphatidate cytidylyltransferase, partial [Cyanobacteria bacterium J06600_6]